jgi:hypothetical protein
VSARRRNGSAPAGDGAGLALELPAVFVEAVVERAAELIAERAPSVEALLTVDELAGRLQVSTDWVRRHQAELGGYRLSEGGGRSPVRFRPSDVERFLSERRLRPPARAGAGGWRDDPGWADG